MSATELHECRFLIPITGDDALSDGLPHSPAQWQWLRMHVLEQFGGARRTFGLHDGFYTDPDTGMLVDDLSREYVVAIPAHRIDELRELLRTACDVFHQKCVYLSIAGKVEFVARRDA